MGHVERTTLRFPGNNIQGDVLACGVPGPALSGGAAACPDDKVDLAFQIQDSDRSSIKLDMPPMPGTLGRVNAIAIAPDSAIACCDIALHGEGGEIRRHRISPGNPLVGTYDADFAIVSIPEALPQIPGATDRQAVYWDTVLFSPSTDPAQSIVGFPLRLEMWRGDVVPLRTHRRAPYLGHMVGRIRTTDAPATRKFYICTDGRRRIDATVSLVDRDHVGDTLTVTAYQITANKGYSSEILDTQQVEQLILNDAGDYSVVIDTDHAGTGLGSTTFSFDGNPIPILLLIVTATFNEASVGPTDFQIRVRAED
jgi:hypothetical protein